MAEDRHRGWKSDGAKMESEPAAYPHAKAPQPPWRDLPDMNHPSDPKEMRAVRASKLIAISTVAILAAGANLAVAGQSSLHSGSSMHGSIMNKGTLHGANPGGLRSHGHGPFYGAATSHEIEGLNTQERSHLRDMVRDMPRISNVGTDIRINAIVPKNVRQAAAPLPQEIQRLYPRFRQSRAFVHRDQIVIVNPVTSRIVALVRA
jgi:hypothetical protein